VCRRRFLVVPLALAALAGCGGDEKGEAEATVREFVRATNERDGEAFCEDLVTQEFLEQSTGATGDNAAENCRRQFSRLKGVDVELVRIRETRVDGDEASVSAVIVTQGQRQDQLLRLRKEDGDWRLTGNSGD
jgi:hypothetical protein